MISEKETRQIIDKVLSFSKADETEVTVSGGSTSHLRFSLNRPDTSGTASNTTVSIRSTLGKRTGEYSTNRLDSDALSAATRRAEELAKLSPEDPEFLPGLGPQEFARVSSYFETTPNTGPEFLSNGASVCIKEAVEKNLISAGFLRSNVGFSALGNSKGLFGYNKSTLVSCSETVRTSEGDGSGWASRAANKKEDLRFKEIARIAVDKALLSSRPRRLDPGKYVTILEPSCVAELITSLRFAMEGRSADEGRSFFSQKGGGNRIGEKIFPESVNIYSDPKSPLVPGSPWGPGGLPQKRVDWIENGVVRNLSYSRYWAAKQGKEPVPFPSNIIMTGGTASIEDLIKSTDRGVLVSSFWYIRPVDPRSLLLTGLTRDGVFWIENGKIAYPVNNFRWNDSPVSVLKNLELMSATMRVPPRESGASNIVIPALKVKEFNFSSMSEAV